MSQGDRMFAADTAGKHIRVGDTVTCTPTGYGGAIAATVTEVFDDKSCRVQYKDRGGSMRDFHLLVSACTGKARGDTGTPH